MKYAVVEEGTWTGEVVEEPRKHTDVALPNPAKIRDYTRHGFYPVRERGPEPSAGEQVTGHEYDLDTQRGVMRKVRQIGPMSVEKRKQEMMDKAKTLRTEKARQPVTYDGNHFDADSEAQSKLTGKLTYAQAAGKDTETGWSVGWKTANDDFVQLSYTDLGNVVEAVNNQIQAAYNREAEIIQQIQAASTQEELSAIDLTTGWP